jgi:hypothetical protein
MELRRSFPSSNAGVTVVRDPDIDHLEFEDTMKPFGNDLSNNLSVGTDNKSRKFVDKTPGKGKLLSKNPTLGDENEFFSLNGMSSFEHGLSFGTPLHWMRGKVGSPLSPSSLGDDMEHLHQQRCDLQQQQSQDPGRSASSTNPFADIVGQIVHIGKSSSKEFEHGLFPKTGLASKTSHQIPAGGVTEEIRGHPIDLGVPRYDSGIDLNINDRKFGRLMPSFSERLEAVDAARPFHSALNAPVYSEEPKVPLSGPLAAKSAGQPLMPPLNVPGAGNVPRMAISEENVHAFTDRKRSGSFVAKGFSSDNDSTFSRLHPESEGRFRSYQGQHGFSFQQPPPQPPLPPPPQHHPHFQLPYQQNSYRSAMAHMPPQDHRLSAPDFQRHYGPSYPVGDIKMAGVRVPVAKVNKPYGPENEHIVHEMSSFSGYDKDRAVGVKQEEETAHGKAAYKEFCKEFREQEKRPQNEVYDFATKYLEKVPDCSRWRVYVDIADFAKRHNNLKAVGAYIILK